MTPKSDNPKTANFSMRFDPELKEALLENVDAGKGGRAGGLSLLFHRLGYLYLDLELPPQRWQVTDDLFDELEALLEEAEGLALTNILTDKDRKRLELAEDGLKALVAPLMAGPPTFHRLRGLVLIARYELFFWGCKVT